MPTDNVWRVLFVDDDHDICLQVAKYLGEQVITGKDGILRITTKEDFGEALEELAVKHYDLVILDVRLGPTSPEEREEEEAGTATLDLIKQRCFLPVIFYTALPNKVRDLETPLIRVAEKTEGVARLLETVREVFETKIPLVNRELLRHLDEVQRDYMWDFVAANWEVFGDTEDKSCLAYLLARRLAKSLDSPGMQKLAERLGGCTDILWNEDNVHPMRYYIMPPVSKIPRAGDMFKCQIDGKTEYLVLLTPSCDIEQGNADSRLFAKCLPLSGEEEYVKFAENVDDGDAKGAVKNLIRDSRKGRQWERFKFLPGVINVPDMVVDFQQTISIIRKECEDNLETGKWERIASLDSPYSEALLNRYSRYFGRLGTPDLNVDVIIAKLEKEIAEKK